MFAFTTAPCSKIIPISAHLTKQTPKQTAKTQIHYSGCHPQTKQRQK
jgi:hypothetical protein